MSKNYIGLYFPTTSWSCHHCAPSKGSALWKSVTAYGKTFTVKSSNCKRKVGECVCICSLGEQEREKVGHREHFLSQVQTCKVQTRADDTDIYPWKSNQRGQMNKNRAALFQDIPQTCVAVIGLVCCLHMPVHASNVSAGQEKNTKKTKKPSKEKWGGCSSRGESVICLQLITMVERREEATFGLHLCCLSAMTKKNTHPPSPHSIVNAPIRGKRAGPPSQPTKSNAWVSLFCMKQKNSEAIIKCACDLSFPCIPTAVCFNIWDCVTLFCRDESECTHLYLTTTVDTFGSWEPKHAAFSPCGACLWFIVCFGFISEGAFGTSALFLSSFFCILTPLRFHQLH